MIAEHPAKLSPETSSPETSWDEPSTQEAPLRESPARGASRFRVAAPEVARLLRPAAMIALATVLLAQGVAPACRVVGRLSHRVVDYVELAAGVCSQWLVLMAIGLAIGLLLSVGRDGRVPLVSRVVLVAQTTMVFVIALPSTAGKIPTHALVFMGSLVFVAALVAAVEALRVPRSRALGLVVGMLALGCGTRIIAAGIAESSWRVASDRVAVATMVATASVLMHGMGLLIALSWLASRRGKTVSVGSLFALSSAVFVTWVAASGRAPVPSWMLFVSGFQNGFVAVPKSLFPDAIDRFVAVLGPITAVVALMMRRQMPTMVGALALVLTAGISVDMPGHALIMMLAVLATVLCVHDDRGMWEALLGKRLRSAVSMQVSTQTATQALTQTSAQVLVPIAKDGVAES